MPIQSPCPNSTHSDPRDVPPSCTLRLWRMPSGRPGVQAANTKEKREKGWRGERRERVSYPIIKSAKLTSPWHLSVSPSQQGDALCSQHGFERDFSSSTFTRAAHRLPNVVATWLSQHAVHKTPRLCILRLSSGMVQSVLTKPRIAHIIIVIP